MSWVVVHGRTDQPGYRYVCTTHWTKLGATDFADKMLRAAMVAGYDHSLYWVERKRPGDRPGMWAVDESAEQ
jgi:hypothetical protein